MFIIDELNTPQNTQFTFIQLTIDNYNCILLYTINYELNSRGEIKKYLLS